MAAAYLLSIEKLGRGLTVYQAKGGYGTQGERNRYDALFTVIIRLKIRRLHIEISKIDSKAFLVISKINDTRGGIIKKRAIPSKPLFLFLPAVYPRFYD